MFSHSEGGRTLEFPGWDDFSPGWEYSSHRGGLDKCLLVKYRVQWHSSYTRETLPDGTRLPFVRESGAVTVRHLIRVPNRSLPPIPDFSDTKRQQISETPFIIQGVSN
jgi:hypothetical protein